jgi:hypothetical protein
MTRWLVVLTYFLALSVWAQSSQPAAPPAASSSVPGAGATGRSNAPLEAMDDVDPAVNVGSAGLGNITRLASPGVPASPTAPASPAAPPAPSGSRIMDTLDLGTTSITGNQELPKVLYIVPWKKSDLGDLVGRPVNTLLDEVLAPVDPEVFERHLEYYETLYGTSQEE